MIPRWLLLVVVVAPFVHAVDNDVVTVPKELMRFILGCQSVDVSRQGAVPVYSVDIDEREGTTSQKFGLLNMDELDHALRLTVDDDSVVRRIMAQVKEAVGSSAPTTVKQGGECNVENKINIAVPTNELNELSDKMQELTNQNHYLLLEQMNALINLKFNQQSDSTERLIKRKIKEINEKLKIIFQNLGIVDYIDDDDDDHDISESDKDSDESNGHTSGVGADVSKESEQSNEGQEAESESGCKCKDKTHTQTASMEKEAESDSKPGAEAESEQKPEPECEAGQETETEAGQDAGSGSGQDAGSGSGQDAGSGSGQDAGSGSGQDAGSGSGQDAGSGSEQNPGTSSESKSSENKSEEKTTKESNSGESKSSGEKNADKKGTQPSSGPKPTPTPMPVSELITTTIGFLSSSEEDKSSEDKTNSKGSSGERTEGFERIPQKNLETYDSLSLVRPLVRRPQLPVNNPLPTVALRKRVPILVPGPLVRE